MNKNRFFAELREAIALSHPFPFRGREGRAAFVLLLFGFRKGEIEPHLLLTERTDTVASHKSQIAFPGGSADPEDFEKDPRGWSAALRETEEEVGIAQTEIEVSGALPSLFTLTSNFLVTPVVGVLKKPIEEVEFALSEHEVKSVFWKEWSFFLKEESLVIEPIQKDEINYQTPVFYVSDKRVWGATAFMIQNLRERFLKLSTTGQAPGAGQGKV